MPNFTYYKDKMKPTNTYIPMLIKAFNIIVFTIVWVSVGALTLPFYLAYILIKWRWDKPNKSHKHDNYQSQIDSNLRFMNKKYDTLKQDTAREINELLITIGQLSEQLERVKDKQFKDANDINELEADVELNKKLGTLASEDRINNRLDKLSINMESYDENVSFSEDQIDELKKRISELEDDISSIRKRLDVRETISERLERDINNLNKDVYKDITTWMNITVDNQRDINELQLSLESMKPEDLGTFNFISNEPTQIELAQIEAELDGERVAREEYDWHREQKAKDKQIQDRMRADEAEYDRLSEPVNLDD